MKESEISRRVAPLRESPSTEAEDLARASSDFGRIRFEPPRMVIRASTPDDVVGAVQLARKRGLSLVARGQGHSTRGQASLRDGVVVLLDALDAVSVVDGEAVVGGGARWNRVLERTLAHGLTPPTLTDYLGLSVGGTLSVGGVGGQSFRYGLQTDQVSSLEVVTGGGELLTCSTREHPVLFDACRGALGQCGIVVGAQLKLVRAPSEVRVFRLEYRDLATWLHDQMALVKDGGFDYLLGSILPAESGWWYRLEATQYLHEGGNQNEPPLAQLGYDRSRGTERYTCTFQKYANRLEAMERDMKVNGTWQARHPWMDLFVPASAARAVIDKALTVFSPGQLRDSHTLTYPLSAHACTTPTVPVPRGEPSFLFGVGPNFSASDDVGLEAFERGCREVFELARACGGAVYPIGYPVGTNLMDGHAWSEHFSSAFESLADAKRRYDPDGCMRAIRGSS